MSDRSLRPDLSSSQASLLPQSSRFHTVCVGAACSRRGLCVRQIFAARPIVFASKLAPTKFAFSHSLCGSGLLAKRPVCPTDLCGLTYRLRKQACSHEVRVFTQSVWERACSRRGLCVRQIFAARPIVFASKLAPTKFAFSHSLCGSELAREEASTSTTASWSEILSSQASCSRRGRNP